MEPPAASLGSRRRRNGGALGDPILCGTVRPDSGTGNPRCRDRHHHPCRRRCAASRWQEHFVGLSISTLVISIFGPTAELVASFAWILAASFVVNGLLLLEVASCTKESAEG